MNARYGGLLSSLRDMLKWDAALSKGQILSQAKQDEVWSPIRLNNGLPVPYDHDGSAQNFKGHRLIEFGGGIWGFTTCMARFVDDRLTVIILTNQDSKPWGMCPAVAGLFDPAFDQAYAGVEPPTHS